MVMFWDNDFNIRGLVMFWGNGICIRVMAKFHNGIFKDIDIFSI